MLFNPYVAVFASGGLAMLMMESSPSWEAVAIGIICLVASVIGKFLWKPMPAPKRGQSQADVAERVASTGEV